MIDLAPIKKCLRVSPTLYFEASKLYHSSPLGRHRMLKEGREAAEQLRPRLEYECQVIREYLNDDWTVRHGPFAGMKYMSMTLGCLNLVPKIIGSYENLLHPWVFDAIKRDYKLILNIGCGEGYYAVGLASKLGSSQVYAYDTDEASRDNAAALAQLNDTSDRVHVRDLCTRNALQQKITDDTLIFCDIEGGEFDLFRPDFTPALSRADLIIETHDVVCPGVTEALVRRFLATHRIEVIYDCAKYADDFPVLQTIPPEKHAFLLEEGRKSTQAWMRLLAKRRGAIQSDPERFWLYNKPADGS